MDLEELNKTQIILLTLLVSFVTSIATGIITVTLMDQAPPAVTQTINRIVERTIERVVPAEVDGNKEVTVIEKETTIVVKEEDLITESIEKNRRKIVRLVTVIPGEIVDGEGTSTPEVTREYVFHGIGVIVSEGGQLVTAPDLADIEELVAITFDGVEHDVSLIRNSRDLALLQIEKNTPEEVISLSPVVFVDSRSLKLGQTVIVIGGEDRTSVSMGIIASLVNGDISIGESTRKAVVSVHVNVSGSIPGSPLVNIFGEVVGIDLIGIPGLFSSSAYIEENIKPIASDDNVIETSEALEDTKES